MGLIQDIIDEKSWEFVKETADKYRDDIFGPDMDCERQEGFDRFLKELERYFLGEEK